MIIEKEKKELKKFILSREQPEGGFSFSQTTPPTLEDTYFALRLIEELPEYSVNTQTISYIKQLNKKEFHQLKHLYQLATIYKITHLTDSEKSLHNKIIHNNEILLNTLSDLYNLVLTRELLHMQVTRTRNEKNIISSAQMKSIKSMEECKQLVILMIKLNISFQQQEYVNIIQTSQNRDGGFGIVPHSTSFLEPTYQALRGLKELQSLPVDILECERFIHSCMTNIGGFGRQITTVPSLEYSYYAFRSLKIIDEMKKESYQRE